MTIICSAPDESLGVALRLSGYLDCQARALGENGFEAFTAGPIVSGLLSGAITIFVALIGYRFLLGTLPTLRDGFGWAMRLGLVVALTTAWPAFQTLVYDVAIEGPEELAAALLPAIGLPTAPGTRIEDAYEIIGHGLAVEGTPLGVAPASPGAGGASAPTNPQPTNIGFPASPLAASLLVLSSVGVVAALRLAAGILIAIGPLALVALLFDNTVGLLASWIRALAGAALGVLGATVTSMLEIVVVESQIARVRDIQIGLLPSAAEDPAAFATIAAVFGIIALVVVYASFRAASGLRLNFTIRSAVERGFGSLERSSSWRSVGMAMRDGQSRPGRAALVSTRSRADGVSDALVLATQRDTMMRGAALIDSQRRNQADDRIAIEVVRSGSLIGQTGRRTSPRRSRTAARRDRTA